MAKKAKKIGVSDLAAAWRAGWSPADVNAILDRLETIGDPTDPLPADEDEENDPSADDTNDQDILPEDDDQDEDDEDEDEAEDDKLVNDTKDTLNKLTNVALEVENKRLKDEVKRFQAANRRKDLSGGESNKQPEDALIDTFQSLFS